jgi:D-amino peptidase
VERRTDVRVYISVDLEGVAGISHPGPTEPGADGYDEAVALMIGEANAAIEGASLGGATDVLVNDAHASMHNLRPADIDPRARLLQGQKLWSMVAGAGPTVSNEPAAFDVALLVGYHARAGHPTGTQAHTYTGRVMETRLNGRPTSEIGLGVAVLGQWGIPTGLVTGDDALAEDAADLVPSAERVIVKESFGTNAAASLHPSTARDRIRDASRRAVERAARGEIVPFQVEAPVVLEIDFRRGLEADLAALIPGTARIGDRTLRFDAQDAATMFRVFLASVYLADYVDE